MKKIALLILVTFTFLGCVDDIEFNTPAFQGEKDGNLWEAATFTATLDNTGVLTILATDNFETITLGINSTALGSHDIVQTTSSASLLDNGGILYSTNNLPDPTIQLYPPSGIINLTDVNIENSYISGEFYFNAFNSSGLTSININKGFFHRVPLTIL